MAEEKQKKEKKENLGVDKGKQKNLMVLFAIAVLILSLIHI